MSSRTIFAGREADRRGGTGSVGNPRRVIKNKYASQPRAYLADWVSRHSTCGRNAIRIILWCVLPSMQTSMATRWPCVPLGPEARWAHELMAANNNLLLPGSGNPVVLQSSILCLAVLDDQAIDKDLGEGRCFRPKPAITAYDFGRVGLLEDQITPSAHASMTYLLVRCLRRLLVAFSSTFF